MRTPSYILSLFILPTTGPAWDFSGTIQSNSVDNMSKRFFQYIVSERGRSMSFNAVCAAGISMFSISYLPHTVGITHLREFLQLYRSVCVPVQ